MENKAYQNQTEHPSFYVCVMSQKRYEFILDTFSALFTARNEVITPKDIEYMIGHDVYLDESLGSSFLVRCINPDDLSKLFPNAVKLVQS